MTQRYINGIPIDELAQAMLVIDKVHHEVHEGEHYTWSTQWDLAGDAVYALKITTPASPDIHMNFEVEGAFHTKVQFFEGTTHTTSTDYSSNIRNNNRQSSNTSDVVIATTSTDGSNGTELYRVQFGVDTGVGALNVLSGGQQRGDNEWILATSTDYLILITSLSTDNVGSLRVSWYEQVDRR